jgi:hypothetical protein
MAGNPASRPDWQIALVTTLALRCFYSAFAAAFLPFLHPDPDLIQSNALTSNLPFPRGLHYAVLGIWERFDTLWYLHIAAQGYDSPMAVIFYPLYPALIRLFSVVLPPTSAALFISTAASFFAFWALLRLARDFPDVPRLRLLLLFCVWPASFILFAGYAESLTIGLAFWAIVFARQSRWIAATACGFFAGLARPSGVLVAIPLLLIAWRSRHRRALVISLVPAGLFAYWAWLRLSGRASVVQAYRLHQGMTLVLPWTGFWEALRLLARQHDPLLALKLAMVISAGVVCLRRHPRIALRIEDRAFALALLLQMLMYTGRPLLGAPRYILLVYPAFLVWATWAASWKRWQLVFYPAAFAILNLVWLSSFLRWSLVI